jgi:hypothetical protein
VAPMTGRPPIQLLAELRAWLAGGDPNRGRA